MHGFLGTVCSLPFGKLPEFLLRRLVWLTTVCTAAVQAEDLSVLWMSM